MTVPAAGDAVAAVTELRDLLTELAFRQRQATELVRTRDAIAASMPPDDVWRNARLATESMLLVERVTP